MTSAEREAQARVRALELVAAFKALERNESAVALIDEEGFDVEMAQVLGAWLTSDHVFKPLLTPPPDDGRPTAKAWGWLVAGMRIDYVAIADAANVSSTVARTRLAQLIGNRLIYPDGTCAQIAMQALKATIALRVRRAAKPPRRDGGSTPSDPRTGSN